MSSTDGETGMRNLTDKANYERLRKGCNSREERYLSLDQQITDVLNSSPARVKSPAALAQARANVDSVVDDMSSAAVP